MGNGELSRRGFLQLCAGSATGLALAACVPAAPQPAEEGAAVKEKAPVQVAKVQFWDFPFYSTAIGEPGSWQIERADAFMKEHADVQVEVLPLTWEQIEKVTTSIAAGSPPDLVGGGWIMLANQALGLGLALDLSDSLEQQLKDDMIGGMLEQCSIDGRVYMVPYWPVCQSAVVYLDTVEEADALDLAPGPPCYGWTIEEINGWLQKMRGQRPDGTERYGLGIPSAHSTPAFHWVTLLFFRSFGATFWTDESETCVDFATPESIKCLAWMQWLAKNDLIPDPAGYTGQANQDLIGQGNVAMQLGNVIPGQARQEGMVLDSETLIVEDTVNNRRWRYVQFPHDGSYPAICWGGANYSGLVPFRPKDSNTIPGLVKLIHWMTNEESERWLVKTAGMLPFRKSVAREVEDDALLNYATECLLPNAWFDAKRSTEIMLVRSIFEEHFQDAWAGKGAEEVLVEMTDDINAALKCPAA